MDSTKIVGEKIKSLRETKEISVAELAVRSGLAEEQIERIENNVDLPSLAPLIKIARALGVRLGTFLDDQEEQGAVICRKQESEDTISFSNNAMDLRTHMRYHSLSKSKADRHMEPFIVDVEPTEESHFSLSSHEGEEFIYVMEGAVEVCHGKKCHLIKAGDSIYYCLLYTSDAADEEDSVDLGGWRSLKKKKKKEREEEKIETRMSYTVNKMQEDEAE